MKPKAELLKTIELLREYDHVFIAPEGARDLAEPFGVLARTSVVKANPQDPKGLTLADGSTEAEGVDATLLAMQICGELGIGYESKFGRGSQLRACCNALEAWAKELDQ